ncbi:MAG: T9SS type A sorting domain-containing protein, partial [Schleiferiaceae bacterium]|nr:T9SS type A sorting domain-containing protein [Schleiferiaceae bacterium]MDG1312829.1 T9SS type A sorting domain-containing protein [Schleiferiaceae bacterium]
DATAMTDADGDGVYEVTVSLLPGAYEWKFTADNWAVQENLDPATSDSVCTITQGAFTNRYMMLGGTADTTLEIHGWEQCGNASTVGIEEEAANFVVKPNPASDVLFIENTTGTASTVAIYSVTGAKVMEQNFEANTRLDVATLPRGMYIVRLQNEETDSVIRISLN